MHTRTPVTIVTTDPDRRAALRRLLGARSELLVVDEPAAGSTPGVRLVKGPAGDGAAPNSHVALIATDSIDERTLTEIRAHSRNRARAVVVLASRLDVHSVYAGMEAGASAFVRAAPATPDELVASIGSAVRGTQSVPADLVPELAHRTSLPPRQRDAHLDPRAGDVWLNERETRVLTLLAQGWTIAEIAHEMSYSERTIKNVVHEVTVRLGLRNRTHAVAVAVRDGLI